MFGWGKSAAQKQKEEEEILGQINQLRTQQEQFSDLYSRMMFQCYKKCENNNDDNCAENCVFKYKDVQFLVDDRAQRIMAQTKKLQEEQLQQLPASMQNLVK